MQNALGYGATTGEILEILEIASVMGMQSATTAFPVVAEALASPTEQPDSTRPTEGVRP
jgi:alkylhydroperoxidase/carboxymuconolactone decarboxylase family protein YurZ